MLIPSCWRCYVIATSSLSRRVNANSQLNMQIVIDAVKLIKKGEC